LIISYFCSSDCSTLFSLIYESRFFKAYFNTLFQFSLVCF